MRFRKSFVEVIGLIIFLILLWVIFLMTTDARAQIYGIDYDLDTIAGKEVLDYIEDFHSGVSIRQSERAKSYAPYVVHWSDFYGLDPLLPSVVISAESGWKLNPKCTLKEKWRCGKGLMQVRGVAARGFDLSQPKYQVKAGIRWLRLSIDRCNGSIIRGLMAYQTKGRCKGKLIQGAKKRFRWYKNAIKRHRKTDIVS